MNSCLRPYEKNTNERIIEQIEFHLEGSSISDPAETSKISEAFVGDQKYRDIVWYSAPFLKDLYRSKWEQLWVDEKKKGGPTIL
jgi:hypothetical protein